MEGATGTCIAPPHFVYETRRCVTKVSGDVTWAYGRADGKVVRTKNLGSSATAFARSGNKDLSKCSSTFTKDFSFEDKVWGQYRGRADAYERVITIKRYTTKDVRKNRIPPTEVVSVGAERKVNPVTVWWTQSCERGVEKGRKARDFTANGCKPRGSTSNWNCALPSTAAPYLSGVRNNAVIDVFHDAKKRSLTWRTLPKPTGDVRAIKDKRVRLDYLLGTPFRTGVPVNDPTQHFSAAPSLGAWHSGWNAAGPSGQTEFVMQFFKEGLPGKNLRLRPTYRFDADFKHTYAAVSGIRSDGSLVFTQRSAWAESSAACVGAPTNLAVQRARISN